MQNRNIHKHTLQTSNNEVFQLFVWKIKFGSLNNLRGGCGLEGGLKVGLADSHSMSYGKAGITYKNATTNKTF